ncbi:MAG: hypothetical protein Kow00123_17140 [Anaerolineales bacterium]
MATLLRDSHLEEHNNMERLHIHYLRDPIHRLQAVRGILRMEETVGSPAARRRLLLARLLG